ncbi:muconolactone Delta-isomerase family protein [Arthrobacter sp. 135MFCol5.1]|uniref:muconolactone Delta-isomerase n=1 Tax=Arthrobacter sp. 135MFCol5.1 TaxID=1158050 RepID=UPI0009DB2A57
MEFLVEVSFTTPVGMDPGVLEELKTAEARRAGQLAASGHLRRLWRPQVPGWRNIGLWEAEDVTKLQTLLDSLPLREFMSITIRPLDPHPSDPPLMLGKV